MQHPIFAIGQGRNSKARRVTYHTRGSRQGGAGGSHSRRKSSWAVPMRQWRQCTIDANQLHLESFKLILEKWIGFDALPAIGCPFQSHQTHAILKWA